MSGSARLSFFPLFVYLACKMFTAETWGLLLLCLSRFWSFVAVQIERKVDLKCNHIRILHSTYDCTRCTATEHQDSCFGFFVFVFFMYDLLCVAYYMANWTV